MEKLIYKIKNKILPQKNIEFFDFPCILSSNHKEMSDKVEALESAILFGRHVSSVRVRPDLLGTCSIEISFDFFDEAFLGESDRIITEKMGKPLYYDAAGRKIWEQNGITVINGGVEVSYNVIVHSVIIYFHKTLMKKHPYEKWESLEEIAKSIAEQWGIQKYRAFTVGGKLFMLHFETEDYHYSFTLIGKRLRMNSFKKELQRGVECPDYYTYTPVWEERTRINRSCGIEARATSFFLYMEEYDKCLEWPEKDN